MTPPLPHRQSALYPSELCSRRGGPDEKLLRRPRALRAIVRVLWPTALRPPEAPADRLGRRDRTWGGRTSHRRRRCASAGPHGDATLERRRFSNRDRVADAVRRSTTHGRRGCTLGHGRSPATNPWALLLPDQGIVVLRGAAVVSEAVGSFPGGSQRCRTTLNSPCCSTGCVWHRLTGCAI